MELMASAAIRAGASGELLNKILDCVSTDAAYQVILENGLHTRVLDNIMKQIHFYLKKKAAGRFRIECIVFSNEYGLLGTTDKAIDLMEEIRGEKHEG